MPRPKLAVKKDCAILVRLVEKDYNAFTRKCRKDGAKPPAVLREAVKGLIDSTRNLKTLTEDDFLMQDIGAVSVEYDKKTDCFVVQFEAKDFVDSAPLDLSEFEGFIKDSQKMLDDYKAGKYKAKIQKKRARK